MDGIKSSKDTNFPIDFRYFACKLILLSLSAAYWKQ